MPISAALVEKANTILKEAQTYLEANKGMENNLTEEQVEKLTALKKQVQDILTASKDAGDGIGSDSSKLHFDLNITIKPKIHHYLTSHQDRNRQKQHREKLKSLLANPREALPNQPGLRFILEHFEQQTWLTDPELTLLKRIVKQDDPKGERIHTRPARDKIERHALAEKFSAAVDIDPNSKTLEELQNQERTLKEDIVCFKKLLTDCHVSWQVMWKDDTNWKNDPKAIEAIQKAESLVLHLRTKHIEPELERKATADVQAQKEQNAAELVATKTKAATNLKNTGYAVIAAGATMMLASIAPALLMLASTPVAGGLIMTALLVIGALLTAGGAIAIHAGRTDKSLKSFMGCCLPGKKDAGAGADNTLKVE